MTRVFQDSVIAMKRDHRTQVVQLGGYGQERRAINFDQSTEYGLRAAYVHVESNVIEPIGKSYISGANRAHSESPSTDEFRVFAAGSAEMSSFGGNLQYG